MHDPLTVAHEIKNPFLPARKHKNADGTTWTYRHPLVTVWHKDPERDGSDDSCGWFSPKLTKQQLARLGHIAADEAHEPWFLAHRGKKIEDPIAAEVLTRAAFALVARTLRVAIANDEATAWAIRLVHDPVDNIRGKLAFLPGYHSNFPDDREEDRKDEAMHLFCIVARYVLRERRPWYRHPRWHVRHWQIQVHPVQHFKRWAFSRCAECGKRFGWGESPVSGSWYGTGPLWFRSERGVRHCDCDRNSVRSGAAERSKAATP